MPCLRRVSWSVHLEHTNQLVMAVEERSLSQLTEEFVKYDTGFRPPYALQVSPRNVHFYLCVCIL